MDTHYLSPREVMGEPVPKWAYEEPWTFKDLALTKKLPANPLWLGTGYRVAPVEVMVTAKKLVGVDYHQGEKLRKWFRDLLQGEKHSLWYGRFADYDILAFRSGFFLIGKFRTAFEATDFLRDLLVSDWLSRRSGEHYTLFDPDNMAASQFSSWYGDNLSVPSYSVTSSIAFNATNNPEVSSRWREWVKKAI